MTHSAPSLFRMESSSNMRCARTGEAFCGSRHLSHHDFLSANLSEPIPVRLRSIRWKWMDFLTPDDGSSPLLCSERVFRAIQDANLSGYKSSMVKLYPPPGKKIAPPCRYFWLIPIAPPFKMEKQVYLGSRQTHQYRLAFNSKDSNDPRFREVQPREGEFEFVRNVPLLNSWDGSDFNMFTEIRPTNIKGTMFCSRRVLDLAATEKWTNIQFAPVDALEPVEIDFLKGPWPPVAWYSEHEPE